MRLTLRSQERFTSESFFDELARTLCRAECLPRKELFESWEVARRVRKLKRGGRVVDLACGHGLVGALMLLLDDTSPEAFCVDKRIPKSAARVLEVLVERWPRLAGRITHQERSIEKFALEPGDLVVSAHACGALTDKVIKQATDARAHVAVLPCCHPLRHPDARRYPGWLDGALQLDLRRAFHLELAGYRVYTRTIPEEVTPKNRLLIGLLE